MAYLPLFVRHRVDELVVHALPVSRREHELIHCTTGAVGVKLAQIVREALPLRLRTGWVELGVRWIRAVDKPKAGKGRLEGCVSRRLRRSITNNREAAGIQCTMRFVGDDSVVSWAKKPRIREYSYFGAILRKSLLTATLRFLKISSGIVRL